MFLSFSCAVVLIVLLRFMESGSLLGVLKKFGQFPETLVGIYITQVSLMLFVLEFWHLISDCRCWLVSNTFMSRVSYIEISRVCFYL